VVPAPFAAAVVAGCGRNLRRALLTLESSRTECYPFADTQKPRLPDWQNYIVVRCGSAPARKPLL